MRRTSLPEVRFFGPTSVQYRHPAPYSRETTCQAEPRPPDDFYRRSVANDRMCQVMLAATASSDACAHGHASTTAKTQ